MLAQLACARSTPLVRISRPWVVCLARPMQPNVRVHPPAGAGESRCSTSGAMMRWTPPGVVSASSRGLGVAAHSAMTKATFPKCFQARVLIDKSDCRCHSWCLQVEPIAPGSEPRDHTDIQIENAEFVSHQVTARIKLSVHRPPAERNPLMHRLYDIVSGTFRCPDATYIRLDPVERVDRRRNKEHPSQELSTPCVAQARRQPGVGIGVSQVDQDGCTFRQHLAAWQEQGRDLAHGVVFADTRPRSFGSPGGAFNDLEWEIQQR